ncbi:hypothetical protein [Microbispora sp. NPDC049125]|uniref:hypothetical protein n=1 Tax=Microbispora sp. NPDC049125 TaxID=3154929 RepID=UPI0034668801
MAEQITADLVSGEQIAGGDGASSLPATPADSGIDAIALSPGHLSPAVFFPDRLVRIGADPSCAPSRASSSARSTRRLTWTP